MDTNDEPFSLPRWLRIVLIGRNPAFTLLRVAVLVALVFFIRAFVLLPIQVKGPSMLPTYQESGINFVNRLAYFRAKPQRGDVVAIRTSGTSIMYMKRIVGMPGETVAYHQGRVFIDGHELEEPYMNFDKYPCDWEMPPKHLAADEYYFVGDNRTMPRENHYEGKTPQARIIGKVLLCKNLFGS
jgi:signal peptidase I